jgi:serine/threonine protein kinase, bacterial
MKHKLLYLTMLFTSLSMFAQEVTTYAGNGIVATTDGIGTAASIAAPRGIAIDGLGNLYLSSDERVRKITPTGEVSTLAGNGNDTSIDGIGTAASIDGPFGIAVDAMGNVYVSERNRKIRKITSAGEVTTFAGNNIFGSIDGIGTAASFRAPRGIAIDAFGNLYVVDQASNNIRKITLAGVVSTFVGSGVQGSADGVGLTASFDLPQGIAIDAFGNLYVTDTRNNKIRKITSDGVVSTFAGSGTLGSADGISTAASFNSPEGIAVDALGNLYITDANNHKIRKITSNGVVSTLAGSSTFGSADGIGTAASFHFPKDIVLDTSGNLYIADTENHKIRKITFTLASEAFNANTIFKVHPNPAKNQVNIEVQELDNAAIAVYDTNGRQLFSQKLNNTTNAINIENLASGVYLFKVTSSQGTATSKVVKQ